MRFTSLIPRSGKTYSGALVAALLFAPWSGGAAAAVAPIPGAVAETGLHEAVLEVAVSRGGPGHMMIVLRGPGGALLLEAQDFQRLRLRVPSTRPVLRDGRRYYSPAAIPGSSVSIDEARQRAVISVPSAALDTTRLSAPVGVSPTITPASPGAFFNYQLYSQHVTGQTSGGVYGELGVFAGAGVLTNSEAGRTAAGRGSLVRLDTTYTVDFAQRLETLNVGDAISDSGTWGYAVRYAGIRWSRNFALRPDLLTTPLLTTGGTATVPSTVDVFVNNQLVTSSQLPAGPFVIDRLPTVSGSGDVSVVVRDALGREQVLTQSFYSSPSLLAPGLSQYSFNLGSVREDYALASSRYGTMLAEGSYRRGIRRNFTLEGHAEYQRGGAHAA
ncbi:MAG: fimbrial biogenesis outer membrane usher protein, partial [Gammaproteobacteria bacterium]|nr:fimbrial biogenesis outer membrane usher protein [Gammaproteobacteria bacterium]